MITLMDNKITVEEVQANGRSETRFSTDQVKSVELFSNRIVFTHMDGSTYGLYRCNHKDMTEKEFMEVSLDIANSIPRT